MAIADDLAVRRRAWLGIAALGLGFVLLMAAMAGVLTLSQRSAEADRLVGHTMQVRQELTDLKAAIVDAETGQRGYMITGQEEYLDPLTGADAKIGALLADLHILTADNPTQTARLNELTPIIEQRMEIVYATVEQRRAGRSLAAIQLVSRGEGKRLMDDIRRRISEIDAEERALFERRTAEAAQGRAFLFNSIVLGVIIAVALSIGVFVSTRRYLQTLEQANRALTGEMRERASAEAQLRQSQKMEALGRLTGGVAHDFNNMLAIVVGSLDLLLRRLQEGRERDLAQQALEGAKRAGALTQRLLAFSRQQPLEPAVLEANKVAADMMVMLQRTLGEQVHVETVQGGGLWRTFIDRPQLESAILNLAVNARDAMPKGGKLTIETANTYLDDAYASTHTEVTPGQYVLIAVTDTGTGMPQHVIDNAFEPFFTTKAQGVGTGLGLSQVHGFIKQSGGHVKIYSEQNVGTTIKLYLPRYMGDAQPEAPAPRVAPSAPLSCKVLVVEDEEGVRRFVVEALHELGCTTLSAESADEAIIKLRDAPDVQVLLTDVVMPGRSGRQLADQALKMQPGLRVIFMTGYTRNAIVHNGTLDAGTQLMTKPFTLAQLELELAKALGR